MTDEDQGSAAPEVWAVASYRAGETSQIVGLAQALGRPWRRIDLDYRRGAGTLGLARTVTALGTSTSLAPPWPRLVISAGLRNEPICRWIRSRSGGRSRLVFVGRTFAPTRSFDLVVTTPQYRVAAAANVLENPLTLHAVDEERLQSAAEQWRGCFAAQQRHRIGVLIGGDSGPYDFGGDYARRLAEQLNSLQRSLADGQVKFLISTSSRTPAGFLERLLRDLQGDHYCYDWGVSAGENPYLGILACAEELVITADSIAMLSEAVATGKRVLVAQPPDTGAAGFRASLYRWGMRWGHPRWTRDVSLIHRRLFAAGLAAPLIETIDVASAETSQEGWPGIRRVAPGGEYALAAETAAAARSGAYQLETVARIDQLFA